MIGTSIFLLLPLTDWNSSATSRYLHSWLLILLVQLMVVVNMTIVIRMSAHSIKLLLNKYKLLIALKIPKISFKFQSTKKEQEEKTGEAEKNDKKDKRKKRKNKKERSK